MFKGKRTRSFARLRKIVVMLALASVLGATVFGITASTDHSHVAHAYVYGQSQQLDITTFVDAPWYIDAIEVAGYNQYGNWSDAVWYGPNRWSTYHPDGHDVNWAEGTTWGWWWWDGSEVYITVYISADDYHTSFQCSYSMGANTHGNSDVDWMECP